MTFRRLLLATVALVCALQTPAFGWTHTTDGDVNHVVGLVGDSNIVLGSARYSAAMTRTTVGDVPVIVAGVGATIRWSGCQTADCATSTAVDYWAARLPAVEQTIKPDVWWVDLGINDTLHVGTLTSVGFGYYGQKIDYLMRLLPTGARVLWSTLPCSLEPAPLHLGCAAVNNSIAAAPARWPNLTVVPWGLAAQGHPEYMRSPGQIHYSDAGYDALAALVVGSLP